MSSSQLSFFFFFLEAVGGRGGRGHISSKPQTSTEEPFYIHFNFLQATWNHKPRLGDRVSMPHSDRQMCQILFANQWELLLHSQSKESGKKKQRQTKCIPIKEHCLKHSSYCVSFKGKDWRTSFSAFFDFWGTCLISYPSCTLSQYIYRTLVACVSQGQYRYTSSVFSHRRLASQKQPGAERKLVSLIEKKNSWVVWQLPLTVTPYCQDVIFIVSTVRSQSTFNLVQVLLGIASFLIYCWNLQGKVKTGGSHTDFLFISRGWESWCHIAWLFGLLWLCFMDINR